MLCSNTKDYPISASVVVSLGTMRSTAYSHSKALIPLSNMESSYRQTILQNLVGKNQKPPVAMVLMKEKRMALKTNKL